MADTPEQQAEKAKRVIDEYNKSLEKSKKLLDDIVSGDIQDKKIKEETKKILDDINSLQEASLSLGEKASKNYEIRVKVLKEVNDLLKKEQINLEKQMTLLDKAVSNGKITKEQYEDEAKKTKEHLEQLLKQKDLNEKISLEEKKRFVSQTKFNALFEELSTSIGLTSSVHKTWLGQIEQTLSANISLRQVMGSVARGVADLVGPGNLFANAVSTTAEATKIMALQMDGALASFNKVTGAGGKFNDVIDQTRFGSLAEGVGLNESVEAVQALFENFNNFVQLSKDTQVELAKDTAELTKLGISAATTGKMLDITTKALGMSAKQAITTQKSIANEAIQLGLAPGKLADEFVSSIPRLAQYGTQSIEIFKELATQSKATGIDVHSLIDIAQQFDTFEGAARSAGKLNAILGGNLFNSVELLSATESERINILRQGITLSGKNWQEMDKFQKMAVANAAGIKDLNEASRLFGQSQVEFDRVRKAQEAEALSTATLTEYAQKATSAQEKFYLALQGLSVAALPLLNVLNRMLNTFLEWNDTLGGKLAPIVIGLTGGFYLLVKTIMAFKIVAEATSVVMGLFVPATEAATLATTELGIAAAANPIGLIVIAVAAAIASLVLLTLHFDTLTSYVKTNTGGLFDLLDVLFIMTGPMGLIIELGKKTWESWAEAIGGMKELFLDLSKIVQNVFGEMWEFIKEPLNVSIRGINSVIGSANTIPGLSLDIPKIPELAEGITNFGGGMALVGERGPEIVSIPKGSNVISNENTGRLSDAASSLQEARASQTTNQTNETNNNTFNNNENNSNRNNTSETQNTPIILMLDGRELGRAVVNVFEKKLKLNLATT